MPGNISFYNQVHYIKAKFNSICPECLEEIEKDSEIVFLSDFGIAIHHNCFYKPNDNIKPKTKSLDPSPINLMVCPEKETEIYLFRLKGLKILNRRTIGN